MDYEINIKHDLKLIQYKHCGFIDKDEIGKAWQEFLSLKEFTELKYNLFSDYTEAKFVLDIEDVHLITGFLFSIKDILFEKKQALVVLDKYNTAISNLFSKDVIEKVGFLVQVFNNKEEALQWLIA